MTDWIVRKLPDGKIEVLTEGSRREFSWLEQVFGYISVNLDWGDRILTQEVKGEEIDSRKSRHEIGAVGCGCGWHPSCVGSLAPHVENQTDPTDDIADASS